MADSRLMLAAERQHRIMEILSSRDSVSTNEICSEFGVSSVTARHDLEALESKGLLIRVRGGAISTNQSLTIASPSQRMTTNLDSKRTIARLAAERVNDGDSILIDSGTTTLEFLRAISKKRDITIVTNDIGIIELADAILPNSAVMLLGGLYRHGHRLTYGSFALSLLEKIAADAAFMCPAGYLVGTGCMTEHESSAPIKTNLIKHARHCYLLMDTSKIGRNAFLSFATLDDFDEVFLEKEPCQEFLAEAAGYGCKVTYPME